MTKRQYRAARQIIRQNGSYALRWLPEPLRSEMERVLDEAKTKDPLQERASIVAYCQRECIECNVRHTHYEVRRFSGHN